MTRLRGRMVPEYPLYMVRDDAEATGAITGIVDAGVPGNDGTPAVIIDRKSDISPSAAMMLHYQAQVRAYMNMTGAGQGLIVMATSGVAITVDAP